MNHAVLVLQTERAILRDNHRHLRAGGEAQLSNYERADLMAEILRELRDLDRALIALGAEARSERVPAYTHAPRVPIVHYA